MLSTEAGELGLTAQAVVGVRALLNLVELLKAHLSPPEPAATSDSLSDEQERGKEKDSWSSFNWRPFEKRKASRRLPSRSIPSEGKRWPR